MPQPAIHAESAERGRRRVIALSCLAALLLSAGVYAALTRAPGRDEDDDLDFDGDA
jgi:hypothetical protein